MQKLHGYLLSTFMILLLGQTLHSQVRYVRPTSSGTGDGSSWANASSNLQAMINASSAGQEVWVAAGTYKPTAVGDRTVAFRMKEGVRIYGGFTGTELTLNQRNFETNLTTLSGDLNDNDVISGAGISLTISNGNDNSFRVIDNDFPSTSPLTSASVLDGFTIRGGRNEEALFGNFTSGGGMRNIYASPTLSNLIFIGNKAERGGGGILNGLASSPILTNVRFERNISQNDGAGVYCFTSANAVFNNVTFIDNISYGSYGGGAVANFNNTATFTNCRFVNNFATFAGAISAVNATVTVTNSSALNNGVFQSAGLIYAENSTINLFNNLIAGNRALNLYGGALFVRSATVNAVNCLFWNNTAGPSAPFNQSGVFYVDGTNPSVTVQNCIIWSNQSLFFGVSPTVSNSIIQGGFGGCTNCPNGNGNVDPQLIDPANSNFRLGNCSPAINAGNNAALPGTITTDLDGSPRFFNNGLVDLGPYERQGTTSPGNPAVFGNQVWNVYVWNAGEAFIPNTLSWTQNYAGFYVEPEFNINTELRWPAAGAPSSAPGYTGCPVGVDNHSYSYKRRGFPTAFYQIDVNGHDDAAQLFVNGALVWQFNGCCQTHINVWSGNLSSNDEVEFRVTEGGGGSASRVTFLACPPSIAETARTWTGTTNSDWFNAANWNPACVPTVLNDVIIAPASNQPTLPVPAVAKSLQIQGNATLTIQASGQLSLEGTRLINGSTITCFNEGTLINQGAITCASASGLGQFGLWNVGNLQNQAGAVIRVDGTSVSAIVNGSGNWTNAGQMILGSVAGVGQTSINNQATFQNLGCGILSLFGPIANISSLTNVGLLTCATTNSHLNSGTLNNNGIISYPLGNAIPNVINNEIIILPTTTTACNEVTSALQLGSAVDYAIEGVFLNETGTSGTAGTYTVGTNTFTSTLNLAEGTTTYYVRINDGNCVRSVPWSVTVPTNTRPGNPTQFGNNVWNVYVWGAGGAQLNPSAWSDRYSGFFTAPTLNINTELYWPSVGSPSQASGYLGCQVGPDEHSYSFKRRGFPTNFYQLDVDGHDDAAQLWINGTKVWEFDGCCQSHINIWTGSLSATDEVEFRVTEGGGGSNARLNFISCPVGVGPVERTWTGAVNADWFNAGNWSPNCVPSAMNDVVIPPSSVQPVVNQVGALAKSVLVQTGATLTIQTTGSLRVANAGGRPSVSGTVINPSRIE